MRLLRGGRWLAVLLPFGLLLPAGCSNNPPTQAQATQPAQPPAEAVSIKLVKYEGMLDAVKQHKGKVVVVDVWAVW